MRRIVIIGNSGAGKSTLASDLALRLSLSYVASDPFYWEKGWNPAASAVVRQRVAEAVAAELWVMDGNFVTERDMVWGRADTIVWLDYSLPLVLWRVCGRNLRWLITQEHIWSGNQMTPSRAWSGIRHALRTYGQKQSSYPVHLAEFPYLQVMRFRTPRETKRWLATIEH